MLALEWDNVDLKKKAIHIRGARVRGADGLIDKPQNKSDKSRRTIPIVPPLWDVLNAVENKSGPVVTMPGDTILKSINRICQEQGLPEVGLHGLRHSFASLAYHLQIPEMIAAEIGGWNDLSTMHNIYTHLAQSDIAKRAQDFSDFFDPKKKKKAYNGNEDGNEKADS